MSDCQAPTNQIKHRSDDTRRSDDVFNLSIDEVKMVVRYRSLSPHQQRGVLQAIDVIRPAVPKRPFTRPAPSHPFR